MVGPSVRAAWRLVVLVIGGLIVLAGLALLVLPGPGLLVIFVGFSLLASEFPWARVWLRKMKAATKRAARRARDWRRRRSAREAPPTPPVPPA